MLESSGPLAAFQVESGVSIFASAVVASKYVRERGEGDTLVG
jgi:hypothetical protein